MGQVRPQHGDGVQVWLVLVLVQAQHVWAVLAEHVGYLVGHV